MKKVNKNRSFIDSFKNAFLGLVLPFGEEMNLRIHFAIANLITFFAYFFGISKIEWAMLFVAIAIVIISELINTAIENAVDTATLEFSEFAKKAKDTAAGAVLFSAIFAIGIGIILFLDVEKIVATLTYIVKTPKTLIIGGILVIIDILFIIFGRRKKGN